MHAPRFRIRTLMIAVAGVAMLLGGIIQAVRLPRIARRYRQFAAKYASESKLCLDLADSLPEQAADLDQTAAVLRQASLDPSLNSEMKARYQRDAQTVLKAASTARLSIPKFRKKAAYYSYLNKEYLQASKYPLFVVPPDPPPPE